MITLDHLRAIASRVKEIAGDCPAVQLAVEDDDRTTKALLALGGVPRSQVTTFRDGRTAAIFSARLDVDGVEFAAQWARDATVEEIAEQEKQQSKAA